MLAASIQCTASQDQASDACVCLQSMSPHRQTQDWSGSRGALAGEAQPAAAQSALSAREASCLCDTLVRLYHLGMVGAFRHVLYYQQSGTQALQHYDELQQRLPVSVLSTGTLTTAGLLDDESTNDLDTAGARAMLLVVLLMQSCHEVTADIADAAIHSRW